MSEVKDRSRSRWTFRSWRMRSMKRKNKNKPQAKTTCDDSQIMYSTETTTAEDGTTREKMTVTTSPTSADKKSKKMTLSKLFRPWKWRKKRRSGDDSAQESDAAKDKNRIPGENGGVGGEERLQAGPQEGGGDASSSAVTQVEINSDANPDPNAAGGQPVARVTASADGDGGGRGTPKLRAGGPKPAVPPKTSPALTNKKGKPMVPTPDKHRGTPPVGRAKPSNGSPAVAPKKLNFDSASETIPAAPAQCNGDVSHDSDYDNNPHHGNSDSDSDVEEEYCTSLAAKVKRNNSLAIRLENRPSRATLEERNIIPHRSDDDKKIDKEKIGAALVRRLSQRPTQEELEQRNIYRDQNQIDAARQERDSVKRTLTRKLSLRPTVEELRKRNILIFNEYVEVIEAVDYDRKADKPWTRLTPQDKACIRKELNDFKSTEMSVHDESKKFTRFHRP